VRRAAPRLAGWALLVGAIGLPPPAHGDVTRCPLWTVAGTHNRIYLLGSVHLLRPDTIEWSQAIEAAYADAEALVFEIDLDDIDAADVAREVAAQGMLPPDQTLADVLDPQTHAGLEAFARQLGIDPARLEGFRPWFATLMLTQAQLAQLGFRQADGVEERFLKRAQTDRKEVLGLETMAQGLASIAALPMNRQRDFVAYTVAEAAELPAEIDAMLDAWRKGDAETLAGLLARGFDEFPDLYGPLTVDRNRRWVRVLEDHLDDDRDYLVVVGALHLVGEDSVVDLLRKQGYPVERDDDRETTARARRSEE
jgi:uncharacterized protein